MSRILDSTGKPYTDPETWKETWAVIFKVRDKPVVRDYLWSVGFTGSATEALDKVERLLDQREGFLDRKARDQEREQPYLHTALPGDGGPKWGLLWKDPGSGRVRHYLWAVGECQPSPELALERVAESCKRFPPFASSHVGGRFYPVCLHESRETAEGTFYPVRVDMSYRVEVAT